MDADTLIEKAISEERDVQTIKQHMCKCGGYAAVAETLFRTKYRVECYTCHESSGWFPTIDEAVKEWNKSNPKKPSLKRKKRLTRRWVKRMTRGKRVKALKPRLKGMNADFIVVDEWLNYQD